MPSIPFNKTLLLVFVLALSLAACAPAVPGAGGPVVPTQAPPPAPTAAPTALPTALPPTTTPAPTLPALSFDPATYTDEAAGFKLNYPADWTLKPKAVIGSRGSQAQLLSPGVTAETLLAGGSRVGITIYQWDPKGDLAAFATHRKGAWDASGFTLVDQAGFDLPDGRKAMSYVVESPEKAQAFFLFTTVGNDYLEVSGEGNLPLVKEIAGTVRSIDFKP